MSKGKQSWLGYTAAGRHNRRLTTVEAHCMEIIKQHVGEDTAMPAPDCAAAVFGVADERNMRDVRELTKHLRIHHRIPIMSKAGVCGGYYLPGSADEVAKFYQAFHRRAMTGLVNASLGRKAAFIDTVEQLTLWFDEPEGEAIIARLTPAADNDPIPAWVQLVTRHLERLSSDPQRYAAEIAALQDRFGEIFVRRETLARIRSTAEQLQTLLKEVA